MNITAEFSKNKLNIKCLTGRTLQKCASNYFLLINVSWLDVLDSIIWWKKLIQLGWLLDQESLVVEAGDEVSKGTGNRNICHGANSFHLIQGEQILLLNLGVSVKDLNELLSGSSAAHTTPHMRPVNQSEDSIVRYQPIRRCIILNQPIRD